MAQIVAGFGTSFSPQLHVSPDLWPGMGERDKGSNHLIGPDGKDHTYAELAAMAGPEVAKGLSADEMKARHAKSQEHIATISKAIRETDLDALVVFADDENYLFSDYMRPSAMLYFGATVPYLPRKVGENAPEIGRAHV